ncbi:MAG: hypothetical protein HUU21_31015 [Polyangiaceae bacterium]|nr:hypothetical protein [Polyangiaceae bacterium]
MKAKPGIYKPLGLDKSEFCHPVEQKFEWFYDQINGTPRQATWTPVTMRLIHKTEGRKLVRSDSPWLGAYALIFRRSAIEALGPMLREHGELLPLECPEAELWVYNPTRVIDALDEEASTIHRFKSGKIMRIKRYVFKAHLIEGVDIFKLPNLRAESTFVSHRFVDLWNESKLTGLEFTPVWSFPD